MFKRRAWIVIAIVAVCTIVLLVRLYGLAVVEGASVASEVRKERTIPETTPAVRGSILDRRGVPLVTSVPAYHLALRAGYFWRGSAAGVVQSTLEAVRRAIPGQPFAPVDRIRIAEIWSDPEMFVDLLVDGCTKQDLLRIPRRDLRWDLYRRLAELLDLESTAALVKRLNHAEPTATLRQLILDGPDGAIGPAPRAAALNSLREEYDRIVELSIGLGSEPRKLVHEIDAVVASVEAQIAARVDRLVEEARTEPDFELDTAQVAAERQAYQDYPYRRRPMRLRVDTDAALDLYLREDTVPGLTVEEHQGRQPLPGGPFHILGRVRELTRDEIDEAGAGLRSLALSEKPDPETAAKAAWWSHLRSLAKEFADTRVTIGDGGIERSMDGVLRGAPGSVTVLRGFRGNREEVLDYTPAVAGCDVSLTIDSDLQAEAESILATTLGPEGAGCAILMDVHSGEVYAMASHPTTAFPVSGEEISLRYGDPGRSLLNRCVRRPPFAYPGSTFKIVPAVAVLEDNVLPRNATYPCYGAMWQSGTTFRCMGTHWDIGLEDAMTVSCNVYFYHAGETIGGRRLAHWARMFGFGERTGIELRDDPGIVYSPGASPGPWNKGDARKLAIGQVNVEVTPLQVLRMTAAIANGGTLVRPTLVLHGAAHDSWTDRATRHLDLSPATVASVREMLRRVVQDRDGTANGFGLEAFSAAGKTGTAQSHIGKPDHAWFVGYAPHDEPRIGVVVFRELCDLHGGDGAGPIAAAMLDAFFSRYPRDL